MLLDRNVNANSGKKYGGLLWIFLILVIVITIFGARDKIKTGLKKFLAEENKAMTKEQVETIVYEFIQKNPQVIISSLKSMQQKEYEDSLKQAKITIQNKQDQLQGKDSGITLMAGNKNGDVTVITFLDYRCGYCKKANAELKKVIEKDANVRVIFKEYPVLGGMSQKLARTALAVYLVDANKYAKFHNALIESREPSEPFIENTLKMLSIDHIKVKEAMKDPRVEKELASVSALAGELGIRGTPAFIIGDELIPGAVDHEAILSMVKAVREKAKEKK
jgi:protein-disulfide isomerase